MSHNPDLSHARFHGRFSALRDHHVLALEGPDAAVFAQAQFMNDVAGLAPGHWQWNGWLTPKGRLIALFALLKFDEQTLWLLLPDRDPMDVAGRLQRFVFRSKVKIAIPGTLRVAGALQSSQWASGTHFTGDSTAGIELDLGGRSLRITPEAGAAVVDGFEQAWAMEDLLHGLPRLPASQSEQWTPQQLSLDRLRAYSVKKGCYPGQEIVARTHFLGTAKRGLVLLETDTPVAIGTEVHDEARVVGTVISAAGADATHCLLAVLPLERSGALRLGDGIVVRERPLGDGLAR